MQKEEIVQFLSNEFNKYSHEKINPDQNIFSISNYISPREVVYTMMKLEENLKITITDIFKVHDSNIMTINNIAESILELL